MIVRRQRVTLVMIQAIAVGSYARHKYVALEIIPASARRRLHLDSGSAAFPVVNVIVDHVELPAGQRAFQSLGVVAVGYDAGHFLPQIVPGPPVQNRNFVTSLQQLLHQSPANKKCSANHQDFFPGRFLTLCSVSRSTQAQGV